MVLQNLLHLHGLTSKNLDCVGDSFLDIQLLSGTISASTLQLQNLCERIVAAREKFTEVQLSHVLRNHNKPKDSIANEDLELSEGRMLLPKSALHFINCSSLTIAKTLPSAFQQSFHSPLFTAQYVTVSVSNLF